MLFKLENPKVFSDVVGIISELVGEVRIKADKEGISIVAIDPANVALVGFKVSADKFSQFETSEKEVLGVSLDNLKAVLRRCKAGSTLMMYNEDNVLHVKIFDKIQRDFSLALIDVESEDKDVPSLEFAAKVKMSTYDFNEVVEDCAVVADSCSFSVENGKFVVEAKGLNSARSEFTSDEAKIEEGQGRGKYSVEYLQKFTKACKLVESVGLNFSDDYPLRLDFKSEVVDLLFVLAPRVENED
ncbi:MAG: proliferating cell nuclear antigen (pcna) [Nanoarchaeota archaeon]|nr:proliferating cell nuclear antigen (pcna) [Nanoarchaeota archaeon]